MAEETKVTLLERLISGSLWLTQALAFVSGYDKSRSEDKRSYHFEIYKDAKKEWRWRLQASNNRIVASSGEGYKNKEDCLHGIRLLRLHTPVAPIEEAKEPKQAKSKPKAQKKSRKKKS